MSAVEVAVVVRNRRAVKLLQRIYEEQQDQNENNTHHAFFINTLSLYITTVVAVFPIVLTTLP